MSRGDHLKTSHRGRRFSGRDFHLEGTFLEPRYPKNISLTPPSTKPYAPLFLSQSNPTYVSDPEQEPPPSTVHNSLSLYCLTDKLSLIDPLESVQSNRLTRRQSFTPIITLVECFHKVLNLLYHIHIFSDYT